MTKPKATRASRFTVVYDPDALIDFEDVKGKSDRKAVFNVVDKLSRLGAQLTPPHVKLLKGESDLFELRPQQGRSAVRPLFQRFSSQFVILAVAKKDDFDRKVGLAKERSRRYE